MAMPFAIRAEGRQDLTRFLCPGLAYWPARGVRDHTPACAARFLSAPAKVGEDGFEIALKGIDIGLTSFAGFFDDGIFHGSLTKSSSGVQMIGAPKPDLRHTSSILARRAALAR
jgi:hypothetical protein